jgi:hypothetical protein
MPNGNMACDCGLQSILVDGLNALWAVVNTASIAGRDTGRLVLAKPSVRNISVRHSVRKWGWSTDAKPAK